MVPSMVDHNDRTRRPPRAPVPAATRRRWLLALGIAGLWLLLLYGTGSLFLATVLLVLLGILIGACVVGLRALGVDGSHPWLQRMAERPWRDGRDVLQQALRHLPELFLVTPSGSLLAPNAVELYMNPDDLASLTSMMDLDLINASAAEVYQAQITDAGARLGSDGPVEVRVASDPVVPAGRYRIRQGRPVTASPLVNAGFPVATGPPPGAGQPLGAGPPAGPGLAFGVGQALGVGQPLGAGPPVNAGHPSLVPPVMAVVGGRRVPFNPHDGYTQRADVGARTAATDLLTTAGPPAIPPLRLLTNGGITETRLSGARAGRDSSAELVLPADPTISRVHAKFVFADGRWWIISLGRNGVTLNGVPVTGQQTVSNGDAILWGTGPDALMSRVQIG
jgi:FHA domain